MNKIHLPLKNSRAEQFITNLFRNLNYADVAKVQAKDFEQAWRGWLTASTYNFILGLDEFKHCVFTPGTTDAFGEFIARHHQRRVRVSKSDFVLTRILARSWNIKLEYLEDSALDKDDCLIVSLPFSGNGSTVPDFKNILEQAEQLEVPVFLDAAYFGISHGIVYPLTYKCITDFVTSLSKGLSGQPLRLGVRFTRDPIDDGASAAMIGMDTFDRLGAYLSIQLLNNFSHDWIINHYLPHGRKICLKHNLIPTQVLTLALGDESMIEFKRGDYIRVSISEELSRYS